MRTKIRFLILGLFIATSAIGQSFKGPEATTYYQFPTLGLQYESVHAYITLDQSEARESMNKIGGKLSGLMGGAPAANQAAGTMSNAMKDITEVWDKWPLKPQYIRADQGKGGVLRLEVIYKPDDTARPMMAPAANATTGIYTLPYKVEARMKVTKEDGSVVMEKNFGLLTGNYKTDTPYKSAADTEDGMGTYEMVCVRVAMNKARQELFGMYGFGEMDAKLQLGDVKEIKDAKKLIAQVLDIFENKKGLLLNAEEKAAVQNLANVMEKGISLTKTKWVVLHNLAVCYAWLEDAGKANSYLEQYYQESKESFDKVASFGKDGGSKSYGLKDLKQYEGYSNIEAFVKYYPKAAKMYPELLLAINRPLKKFTDFYTHNDLLCQIYSVDFPFQFFPLNDFNGDPKNAASTLTIEGMEHPIVMDYAFDNKRRIKELKMGQKFMNDKNKEDDRATRQMQPIYNESTGEFIMMSNPNSRGLGTSKAELRHFTPRLDAATLGEADNIMRDAGFFGGRDANEKISLEFDLKGNMYFNGKANYYAPVPVFNEILASNGVPLKRTDVVSAAEAQTRINEAGTLTDWTWKGNTTMYFASNLANMGKLDDELKQNIQANMVKHVKVTEVDGNGYPKKIEYTFSANGSFKSETPISFKKWVDATKQWKEAKPTVSKDKFQIPASTVVWDCTYEYDDKGNWVKMQVGPYTATRTFKY